MEYPRARLYQATLEHYYASTASRRVLDCTDITRSQPVTPAKVPDYRHFVPGAGNHLLPIDVDAWSAQAPIDVDAFVTEEHSMQAEVPSLHASNVTSPTGPQERDSKDKQMFMCPICTDTLSRPVDSVHAHLLRRLHQQELCLLDDLPPVPV
ncbi:hypothetical protein DFH06DRAFT_1331548 [Mycena polygramma]|nr:hypothetical protein DFH06DRAFT_1331548 [Mycena polygramma]